MPVLMKLVSKELPKDLYGRVEFLDDAPRLLLKLNGAENLRFGRYWGGRFHVEGCLPSLEPWEIEKWMYQYDIV